MKAMKARTILHAAASKDAVSLGAETSFVGMASAVEGTPCGKSLTEYGLATCGRGFSLKRSMHTRHWLAGWTILDV